MLSKYELQFLVSREPAKQSPALSLYIHCEPSRNAMASHQMGKQLDTLLKNLEKQTPPELQGKLREDTEPVREFFRNYSAAESQYTGFIIFSDASERLLWARGFRVPLPNLVKWEENLYLKPLMKILHEYERYGVILIDRFKARLFTIYLKEIEEERDVIAPNGLPHLNTAGHDRRLSQMNLQRKADEHVVWHYKHASIALSELADKREFHHLILGGPIEATRHFLEYLPKMLQKRVIALPEIPVESTHSEILEQTLAIEKEMKHADEEKLVRDLITAAQKNGQAVLGFEEVLTALQNGQIGRFVYTENLERQGYSCGFCRIFFTEKPLRCPTCRRVPQPVSDMVEAIIEEVVRMSGSVEEIPAEESDPLREYESVGAFLRYPIQGHHSPLHYGNGLFR